MRLAGPWRTTGAWWSREERFAYDHGSTFANSNLSCEIGGALLDLLGDDGGPLLTRVRERGASLLARLEGVCASSSSACTSASLQPSHVLRALGLDEDRISGSVRFSLGRTTSAEEVDRAVAEIVRCVEAERREGPRDLCAS